MITSAPVYAVISRRRRSVPLRSRSSASRNTSHSPRSLGDTPVPRSRNPAARTGDYAHRRLEAACNAERTVRRTVIDANDLEIDTGLPQCAFHGVGEPCLRIQERDDDRYHSQPRPSTRFAAINAFAPTKPKTRDDQANDATLWCPLIPHQIPTDLVKKPMRIPLVALA